MEVSKIQLSSAEMELMQNAAIILTKNNILQKTKQLLEDVQQAQTGYVRNNALLAGNDIFHVSPKISRGENYLGLPYLILDYPRQSSHSHFFFIRTMFWWGNFFSCTIHLANESKELFKEKIRRSYHQLENYYMSINDDPWVHHLNESDYRKISSMNKKEFEEACENFTHIKIAGRHSLTEWEKMPLVLVENWKFYLSVCGLIS